MNLAAALAVAAATVNLLTAIIAASVSRAPGWRTARVIACIAAAAGFYNLISLWLTIDGLSERSYLIGGRLAYVVGSLICLTWAWFAFTPEGRIRPEWPAPVRWLVAASALVSVGFALTGWHLQSTVTTIEVPWAHVRYHYPLTTPLGDFYGLLPLALLMVAMVQLSVRRRQGASGLTPYLIGFAVFFVCAVDEFLVANRFITFLSLADVGCVAVVLPLAIQLVRHVVDDAQRLAGLSSQLQGQVDARTAERDAARDALVESERLAALGRLAGGVGHEINNLLTYMFFSLDEVEAGLAGHRGPVATRAALEQAREGAFRIQKVVEGLRSYSRNQGARTRLDLVTVVEAALRVAGPRLRHVARIETVLESSPTVLGDEPKLVQALVNLLVNAGQAVDTLGRDGRVTIRTGTSPAGEATLSVVDNGHGITPDNLARLSQPYFTTRMEQGGLGLGLFVTRGIADAHGGRLEAQSIPDQHTTFTLTFPAAGEATAPTPGPLSAPAPERPSGSQGRVLLVDDDPLVRASLTRTLRRSWTVISAESGAAARSLRTQRPFSLGLGSPTSRSPSTWGVSTTSCES